MNALIIILALALTITVTYFTGASGAAALLVCAAVAVPCGVLISRAGGRFLLYVYILGVLVRVGIGTLIYTAELQEFFGGDALTYDFQGYQVYLYLSGHISYRELGFELGLRDWGMPYLVSLLYAITGQNMLVVQFVNAVIGACTAAIIYFCAHHVFQNLRVARLSAVFVAFYPSLVLWSSQALKDAPVVFLLSAAILLTFKVGERMTVKHVLLLTVTMLCLLSFRFYVFYMMAAAIAGSLVIGTTRFMGQNIAKQFVLIVCVGMAMTYMGVLRTASVQFETFGNLEAVQRSRSDLAESAQTGFAKDVDVSTTSGAISAIPVGMVYLLFAPFPWQLANLRQSLTFPEMLVWWASFPMLVVGLWFTLKYRIRQALPILIFTAMLTLAYSVFQGNVGTAYRQRSQLLVFYFIFASVGFILARESTEAKKRVGLVARQSAQRAAAANAARRRQAQEWEQIADRLTEKIGF